MISRDMKTANRNLSLGGYFVAVEDKLRSKSLDLLFEAVVSLQAVDECYRFFYDLCTVTELKDLAQRFEVALMLDMKKSYQEISSKTGASTATISRVKRFLEYGADGYKMALKRIGREGEGDV